MISGVGGIRAAYQDEGVAREYVERRFATPLGALLHDRQSALLRGAVQRRPAADVLEVAPGPARLTASVADVARRVTLVDASAQMLGEARRRLDGQAVTAALVRGDAFRLPFGCRFDVVYTFRLIRHFAHEDRSRLYEEIARVLKPGGLLIFDAVNEQVYKAARAKADGLQHYDAAFDRNALRAELARAGFVVESLEGIQHAYPTLHALQVLIAPRSARLARWAMDAVDRAAVAEPLEWVVTCRRV